MVIWVKIVSVVSHAIGRPEVVFQELDIEKIRALDPYSSSQITAAIINKYSHSGRYPFDLGHINGEPIFGFFSSETKPVLNHHYESLDGFGIRWLQDIGLVPADEIILKLGVHEQQKIQTLRNTRSELLSALTLPDVGLEQLKLATMLNMWLFITDNFFDKQDCEVGKNSKKVSEIFDMFIDAIKGKSVTLPEGLSRSTQKLMLGLGNAMFLIGQKLRELVSDEDLRAAVILGLELYKKGNIEETHKKSKPGPNKSISFREFVYSRDNAGAVDLVFELVYALKGIKLTPEIRSNGHFINISNLYKGRICDINDVFSFPKEENEGLINQNSALLLRAASDSIITRSTAISMVVNQITTGESDASLEKESLFSDIEPIFSLSLDFANIQKTIDAAISVQQHWDIGHVVWELVCITGRHPKNPIVSPADFM